MTDDQVELDHVLCVALKMGGGILTLHNFHFFSQRHPQAFRGGMSQEVPGILISWTNGYTVFWFLIIFLNKCFIGLLVKWFISLNV